MTSFIAEIKKKREKMYISERILLKRRATEGQTETPKELARYVMTSFISAAVIGCVFLTQAF